MSSEVRKAMTILYKVHNGLYVNLTNRCPCACTFCERQTRDHVSEVNDAPLWLEHEPSVEEVIAEFEKTDVAPYEEIVFCGFGEPTERLDALLEIAKYLKAHYDKPIRIIAGGGSAYIHASKEVAKLADTLEGDEKTGAKVILKALEAPLYYISANAGLEGAVIINKVKESAPGTGFNAATEEYVDMVENGILDPVKVTRSALQNATSVASTLLTTESVVANIKEDAPAMPAGNPGMGMM